MIRVERSAGRSFYGYLQDSDMYADGIADLHVGDQDFHLECHLRPRRDPGEPETEVDVTARKTRSAA